MEDVEDEGRISDFRGIFAPIFYTKTVEKEQKMLKNCRMDDAVE